MKKRKQYRYTENYTHELQRKQKKQINDEQLFQNKVKNTRI